MPEGPPSPGAASQPGASQRSLQKRLWYGLLHVVCRLLGVVLYGIRVRGRSHVPASGGALVLSNHQSHYDPILIGLACDRRLNYVARSTLFRFSPFRWLIHSLDAIPIEREGLGLAGLRETLRRLKRGEMVLLFPEGTRTRNGEVGVFKPGFSALVHRAQVPLVPVAIDGAFDAWPRTRAWPWVARIEIQFGAPLLPHQASALGDRELVAEIERRIRACHAVARARRRASAWERSRSSP